MSLYLLVVCVVSKLFYDNFVLIIVGLLSLKKIKRIINNKLHIKKIMMKKQEFASMLDSFASALSAGYSISNAFIEAQEDIKKLYGKNNDVYKELYVINNQLALNTNLDKVLKEYAKNSELEEVKYFCEVMMITRREGGNLIMVIKQVRKMIYEKIELDRQIQIITASKRYEGMIMGIMPIGIITYLRVFSPGFFDKMYGNILGIVVMSILLIVYISLVMYMDKVSKIEV